MSTTLSLYAFPIPSPCSKQGRGKPSTLPKNMSDYQVTDVRDWKLGEWLAAGGAVTIATRWAWKYVIFPVMKYFKDLAAMPASVSHMRQKQEEIGRLLMMSRSRSYAVLDTQPHPIWESDAEGHCIFANQNMLQVLGVPFEELSGQSWRSIIHQDDREKVYAEWDAAIREHRDFNMEYRWVSKNHQEVGVRASTRRIMDGVNVIGYICNVKILY